ncbi:uncharacterized protein N7459_003894 [Penicillium hispanicum]|uniref:uncharacterized protein n=1 Tax=Penicillium hispanicum TaxID=1080232 RepID=UPI0025416244|nr:uncharacterized protein N7459_003894 [Penicillium hispanicum]KAJ5584094.1 hypothetical protein N7459_003894 [Penicillium hispanicum]
MGQTRPRSRRLVTYGSSSNNNSPSRNPAVCMPDKKGKSRPSRQSKGTPAGDQNVDAQSPSRGATMKGSIYDILSSDGEDRSRFARRKRRRYGSNENISSYDGLSDPRQSHNATTLNPERKSNQTENSATQTRKAVQSQKWPSEHERSRGLQTSPQKIKAAPTTNNLTRIRNINPTTNEKKSGFHAELASNLSRTIRSRATTSPSPCSPKGTRTDTGNLTPGRRRLIDSLGTREPPVNGLSSDISLESQPSSPRTPTRLPDLVPTGVPTETKCESHSQDSMVSISPHLRGSKVTYARQRSFLDDLSLAGGLPDSSVPASLVQNDLLVPPDRHPEGLPRARLFGIDDENNDDGTVRSIHELRKAGINARYQGAVESIFEDIEDPHISASGRCNALIQLCSKLLDSKLARQFVECNFDKRLVDSLSNDYNIVTTSLTFCAFGLSLRIRPLPYVLATAAWPKLLDTSLSLLNVRDDLSIVTRAQGAMLSKLVQRSVQNIIPTIKSKLFDENTKLTLSPCLLALQCLRATISVFQERGESPGGLPMSLSRQLVGVLLFEHSQADRKPFLVEKTSRILILGLSILEAHAVSGDCPQKDHCDVLQRLSDMRSLLCVKSNALDAAAAEQIQTLYLRVILNLTNSNPTLCDSFALPALIEELVNIMISKFGTLTGDSFTKESNTLDTVILALGVLINLTEQSQASRAIFLDPVSITHSLLDRLLRLFVTHVDSTSQAHSVLEVHHNVAVGYLAVLLLALCLNADARLQVKESLHPKGLTALLSTVNEFLQHHKTIEQEPKPAQEETSGFHTRLQDLVSQIQLMEDCT